MTPVTIVRTGSANLASVVAAIQRCGGAPQVTESVQQIEHADRLVLPGVGSFGAVMGALTDCGFVEPLRERVLAGRKTLAICLGLQVLAEGSDESPGVKGLGVLPMRVTAFPKSVRSPQIGWNCVVANGAGTLLDAGHAYFANSFRLAAAPEDWATAFANHGDRFVAAIERGGVLACQFHPELSGMWGRGLLTRWMRCEGGDGAPC